MKTPLTPINQNVINKNTQTYNLTIIWILDLYSFKNEKNIETAKVEMFLRMSCFGTNVQTMFHIKKDGLNQEYIFRQRNTSRTFIVQK